MDHYTQIYQTCSQLWCHTNRLDLHCGQPESMLYSLIRVWSMVGDPDGVCGCGEVRGRVQACILCIISVGVDVLKKCFCCMCCWTVLTQTV